MALDFLAGFLGTQVEETTLISGDRPGALGHCPVLAVVVVVGKGATILRQRTFLSFLALVDSLKLLLQLLRLQ